MKKAKNSTRAITCLVACLVACTVISVQVFASVISNISSTTTATYDAIVNNDEILTVCQPTNVDDVTWTKVGRNATLSANATKVNTNDRDALIASLVNKDEDGNADLSQVSSTLTVGVDDYNKSTTPVYSKIDIVNVDIATGEIIGKLSDPTYNFEWFGRAVTLPGGTTLASGRKLAEDTTFTVDVYTYYPTMYMRRWVETDSEGIEKQWISVSEKDFKGAVEIKEYYTATFTATIWNPDKTAATNSNGIITRSYIGDRATLTTTNAHYIMQYYGYTNNAEAMTTPTQSDTLTWFTNLTKAWETSAESLTGYKTAKSCQGENYTAFVYSYLYLIKYANNNCQTTIGYGNSDTYGLYNNITNANKEAQNDKENKEFTVTIDGTEIKYGTSVKTSAENGSATITYSVVNYMESIKSGGTIGMKGNETNQNEAGMDYGYRVTTFTNTNNGYSDKAGLYSPQFLTYTYNDETNNNEQKRVLLDGYVGSDKYTSVFCLGLSDAWANIFTWVFGQAIVSDGQYASPGTTAEGTDCNIYLYSTTEDFDYTYAVDSANTSWQKGNYVVGRMDGSDYATKNANILSVSGYSKMSYTLPKESGSYRTLGITEASETPSKDMLIGVVSGSKNSANNSSTGLCDNYSLSNYTTENTAGSNLGDCYVFGLRRGGYSNSSSTAGLFSFYISYDIANSSYNIGVRSSLTC